MTKEEIKTEWEKRCDYIKSSKNVNTDEIFNFFIEKVDQLQFELKAADSDYHYKTKELQENLYKESTRADILQDENVKLQSKIDELEKEVLLKIEPALKYFNGFDSEDQNEAAFHALNNLAIDLQAKCCKCEVLGDLAPCDECYYGRTN